jgi:threonine synthase
MRGKKRMNCFILFPEGRVSEIQERQMTTVPDANIHCIRSVLHARRVACGKALALLQV